jgi:prevent-host-death family protein
MTSWQLQAAKARLSELLRSAQEAGPQEITLHGAPAAVVLSKQDYDRLAGARPSFLELVRDSPLGGTLLQLPRREPAASAGKARR